MIVFCSVVTILANLMLLQVCCSISGMGYSGSPSLYFHMSTMIVFCPPNVNPDRDWGPINNSFL
jgi:hypothetical protein